MSHSGTKKAHDWVVDQLPDLFRTTHKVKTQQVVKSRGHHCGDLELAEFARTMTGSGKNRVFARRPRALEKDRLIPPY